jgi:hypothetical protein
MRNIGPNIDTRHHQPPSGSLVVVGSSSGHLGCQTASRGSLSVGGATTGDGASASGGGGGNAGGMTGYKERCGIVYERKMVDF